MVRDMSTSATSLMTAEDLERLSVPGKSFELVRGQLVVREPPGTWHGGVQSNLHFFVSAHVRRLGLGRVYGQDTGFKIRSGPDTVRAPDLAFVAEERVPLVPRRGYAALAPDLVAEILSPDDRPGEVLAKVGDWLDAGTRLVWVIDAERGDARVHRSDGSIALVGPDDALVGEDVLPGFTCHLAKVLE
jgi:Uma2 family endonuclease